MTNYKEIKSIDFGILSDDEIKSLSVCEITNSNFEGLNSVYDPRMGFNKHSSGNCETCNMSYINCPGHMGHISLTYPVFNPMFFDKIINYLKCFCHYCAEPILHKKYLSMNKIQISNEEQFKQFVGLCKKTKKCYNCSKATPKIKYDNPTFTVTAEYMALDNLDGLDNLDIKNRKVVELEPIHVYKHIFGRIKDNVLNELGLDSSMVHPKNMIIVSFPVMPPCARPSVVDPGNITSDDDLTGKIGEIVKLNNRLTSKKKIDNPNEFQYNYLKLKYCISTFYNNSNGQSTRIRTGRPIKGICERLKGKDGRMRKNIMGKRVDYSARTVITPDSNLEFGELGVPRYIANTLTFPERVTYFNIKNLQKLINNNGAASFEKASNNKTYVVKEAIERNYRVGDILLRKTGTIDDKKYTQIIITQQNISNMQKMNEGDLIKRTINNKPTYLGHKGKIVLKIGDVVNRYLQNGDIVLLNRQPTLHKGSMLAKRIKIFDKKTFSINLATTKTFNADFDGDEMNIHVPQSYETRAELLQLSSSKQNIVSEQASKPDISIVQDSLVASFLMTFRNDQINKGHFFDICMSIKINGKPIGYKYIQEKRIVYQKVMKQFYKSEWKKQITKKENMLEWNSDMTYNSTFLLCLLFPHNFNYVVRQAHSNDMTKLHIYNGIIYKGVLDKQSLGSTHNSIIQILDKYYNEDIAAEFITNIQFVTNKWLSLFGYSIGLEDCIPTCSIDKKNIEKLIDDEYNKCINKAKVHQAKIKNKIIRESRQLAALDMARDEGKKVVKKNMPLGNNLLIAVMSGSKGDLFNITQTIASLGQQHLKKGRVGLMLDGKRSLPHYPRIKEDMTPKLEYESRGFIKSSLIKGLNPQEFFFYAMAGRESLCDTAMGTSTSGYIQRKLVKFMEDLQVQYDGTVRDSNNDIIQFSYGDNSYACNKITKVNIKTNNVENGKNDSTVIYDIMDIEYMVNMLNVEHEHTLLI